MKLCFKFFCCGMFIYQRKMVSSKELRELIVLYYYMNVRSDSEFVLLYNLYSPQTLNLPCDLYPHFDLPNLTEDVCPNFGSGKLTTQGLLRLYGFLML